MQALSFPLGAERTKDQARAIFAQGEEAVVFVLLAQVCQKKVEPIVSENLPGATLGHHILELKELGLDEDVQVG